MPTVDESGLPGFENAGWFGLFAPAGTPHDIVDKIYRDTRQGAERPGDARPRLYVQGMAPVGNAPAEFAKAINEESQGWAEIVKNRKLTTN